MYGKIIYYSTKTKKYYTFKAYSPYKLKRKLMYLRDRLEIIIMDITEEWN